MKEKTNFIVLIYWLIIVTMIVSLVEYGWFNLVLNQEKSQMYIIVNEHIQNEDTLNNQISVLNNKIISLNKDIANLSLISKDITIILDEEQTTTDGGITISRSIESDYKDPIKMNVTAYDLSFESCGKYPDHPEYGITASGEKVKEWYTIASGSLYEFGTKVYIPYFKDKPNKGIFVVKDRGGAIKNNCIDIYMTSNKDCLDFGRKSLDVYIIE